MYISSSSESVLYRADLLIAHVMCPNYQNSRSATLSPLNRNMNNLGVIIIYTIILLNKLMISKKIINVQFSHERYLNEKKTTRVLDLWCKTCVYKQRVNLKKSNIYKKNSQFQYETDEDKLVNETKWIRHQSRKKGS